MGWRYLLDSLSLPEKPHCVICLTPTSSFCCGARVRTHENCSNLNFSKKKRENSKNKIQAAIFLARKVSKFIEFSRSWQLGRKWENGGSEGYGNFSARCYCTNLLACTKPGVDNLIYFCFKLLRKFTWNRNFTALCLLEPVIVPDSTAKVIFVFILVRWHNFGLAGSKFPTTSNQKRKLGLNPRSGHY